ncbi:MAG TPA: tyrosine-type recombinase/integrase, partial [Anaerovoracaceae bacterium]|nr:tyrosine-type recombinase/integrase [Anaerovoracaceae bacterium]
GEIQLSRALIKNKETGKLEIKGTKKGVINSVWVDTTLAEDIFKLKEKYEERAKELGDYYHKSDFIFVNNDGTLMQPNSFTQHTKRFREKYNLPYFSLHIFRHTYITKIANTYGAKTAAANSGHASMAGVLWYTATDPESNEKARNLMMEEIPPAPLTT